MLYFDVLSGIRRVLISLVKGRTVLHKYATYNMRSVKPDLDIVLVVQGQIGQSC
jgi:hypothetical protein